MTRTRPSTRLSPRAWCSRVERTTEIAVRQAAEQRHSACLFASFLAQFQEPSPQLSKVIEVRFGLLADLNARRLLPTAISALGQSRTKSVCAKNVGSALQPDRA